MRILLVEESRRLSNWLAKTLRRENYAVDCVHDGDDADYALRSQEYAMVILDLAIPKIDGIEVLRRLRGRGDNVPVLILPPDNPISSRGTGLDSGADDYLAKPFDIHELEARVRAQLRRANH